MRYRPSPSKYPKTWSQVWTKVGLLLRAWHYSLQGATIAELPPACPRHKATQLGLCHWAGFAPPCEEAGAHVSELMGDNLWSHLHTTSLKEGFWSLKQQGD